jgi:hypothetical protein
VRQSIELIAQLISTVRVKPVVRVPMTAFLLQYAGPSLALRGKEQKLCRFLFFLLKQWVVFD